jgi:hypothetical protein
VFSLLVLKGENLMGWLVVCMDRFGSAMGLKKILFISCLLFNGWLSFAQKGILISGYVIDKNSHMRLHAAQVYVKDIGPVKVDDEGNFLFEVKKKYINQTLVIKIKSLGYDDLTFAHTVSSVESLNQGLEIEMAHNSYSLIGQILDSQTKEPLTAEDLHISILGEPNVQGILGNDGSYQIVIPLQIAQKHKNKVTLLVDAAGYRPKILHFSFNQIEFQHILGLLWMDKEH